MEPQITQEILQENDTNQIVRFTVAFETEEEALAYAEAMNGPEAPIAGDRVKINTTTKEPDETGALMMGPLIYGVLWVIIFILITTGH